MRAAIVGGLLVWLSTTGAAQEFEIGLAVADATIEDGDWQAALEGLLALQPRAASAGELASLASRLESVGWEMRAGQDHAGALRAFEAVVVVTSRLHAERDHPDVARGLNGAALSLMSLGRSLEALPRHEAMLAMQRRMHPADHHELAQGMQNLAHCLRILGRSDEALPLFEASLAMTKRLVDEQDHPNVVRDLGGLAFCLQTLGRAEEALAGFDQALAMSARLVGDRDDPDLARSINNTAFALSALGRQEEALPRYEKALAMRRRLFAERDHPDVAISLNNVATCHQELGDAEAALRSYGEAMAMQRRLRGEADHPEAVISAGNMASCLDALGRASEALPFHESAVAMGRRLFADRDHPGAAVALNNLGSCLLQLGRADLAIAQHEHALAMRRRLWGDRDHPAIALSLNNLGLCLAALDRPDEALSRYEEALAMWQRLAGDRVDPQVATGLANVAMCMSNLGRGLEALPRFEAALELLSRSGRADHPDVAGILGSQATCLHALGRHEDALTVYESVLKRCQRLFGDADHPETARALTSVAMCLNWLGRHADAQGPCEQACAQIERLRERSRTGGELQQAFFDRLKDGGAFELLQALELRKDSSGAFVAAERGRCRELLDLLEHQPFEPLDEAERRARARGDEAMLARLQSLRSDLALARRARGRWLHDLARFDAGSVDVVERASRRETLLAAAEAASGRLRSLLDERARLCGEVLAVGRVRSVAEVQSVLQPGELLLEFTLTADLAVLYVLGNEGPLEATVLPTAFAVLEKVLPGLVARTGSAARGRDPEAAGDDGAKALRELSSSLVPPAVWQRIRASRRVIVVPHRSLHRLPLELLVIEGEEGESAAWLDVGPPIAYVPSASALHWLRTRPAVAVAPPLDLLAVGDPDLGYSERSEDRPPPTLRQLAGARAEAEAITAAVRANDGKARLLVGADATEAAVFELAATARCVHFACHGIADRFGGQSLSTLVLARSGDSGSEGDGLLKLDDLLDRWRGRLAACELVVLSACLTNVGPTHRDDVPSALPIGFLLAGARSVVSTLWSVDDASACELMTDFHARLRAGGQDRLEAFTSAKKALRSRHRDPSRWAPFLYMGCPE